MRNAFSILAISATLAAQQPPVLVTDPPVQDPAFGATALGGGVTEVAQITMTAMQGTTPQKWYLTATVHAPGSALYQGYTGEATSTGPGTYSIVSLSAAELINVPPPGLDYFAFNVSDDRKVLVYDTGGGTPPAVFVRTSNVPGTPYTAFGSIGAPVPVGYRDSQMGDTITSWNGTTGVYEYVFINGNDLAKIQMTLTAPSTVTLGTPVIIATTTPSTVKHSPSYMRQYTGIDFGKGRALIHSNNTPGTTANSWFRSSVEDPTIVPAVPIKIFDDANWKANPGHIGGSTYWAYAVASYGNPMKEDIVAMNSVRVPVLTPSPITLVGWAPPGTAPQVGFIMAGLPTPGINLSPIVTRGLLGILPPIPMWVTIQAFDAVLGELSVSAVLPALPRGSIEMQIGMVNLSSLQIFLGNTAAIYIN